MNCPFCNPAVQAHKCDELGGFYALFDRHPVTPGHALVVPKRHVETPWELSAFERGELLSLAERLEKFVESTNLRHLYEKFLNDPPVSENAHWYAECMLKHPCLSSKPMGFNHGFNKGKAAGQTVKHLHWHVIPRYDGDVRDPTGGIRCVIPAMGNYHIPRI